MLEVRFTLARADLTDVWHWYLDNTPTFRRWRWATALIPVAIVAVGLIVGAAVDADMVSSIVGIAVLTMLLLGFSWYLWSAYPGQAISRMEQQWWSKPSPAVAGELTLTIREQGLTAHSSHARTQFLWSAFTGVSDLPRTIVLWQGGNLFLVIPKRAIPQESQLELVRSLQVWVRAA